MREMALMCHVSVAAVSRWETGVRRPHSSDALRIADLLGVTAAQVRMWVDETPLLSTEALNVAPGLRRVRQDHELTRRRLAAGLGVSPATIAHWECGRRAFPLARANLLAEILDLPTDSMIRQLLSDGPSEQQSALRMLRVRAGLTQQQSARSLNVSSGLVGQWERGRVQPRWPQLHRLSMLYGVPLAVVADAVGQLPPVHLDHRHWQPCDLGAILRELRLWRGQSMLRLAADVGVHWQTIRRWERSETVPTRAHRAQLAEALGITAALPTGLAWLRAHRDNVSIIPGTSRVAHLEENRRVTCITLTDGDIADLHTIRQHDAE